MTEPEPPFAELTTLVGPLAAWFTAAGHRIYAVGGLVRDRLLGLELGPDDDVDLTTDATPAEIKAIVRGRVDGLWTQGERFGTIGVHHRGRIHEITTHRAEAYHADSRKPLVEFATDITGDLSRRDFTVNAMAVSLPDGQLIDPFGGRADLEQGRLRTPLSPEVSFGDDPLRMIRAARFLASLRLAAEPELVAAAAEMADRLEIVSIERVMVELTRLLDLPDPAPGLAFAEHTGLLALVLPEVLPLADTTLATLAAARPDHRVRLALLLAPSGAAAAGRRLGALRASNDDRATVRRLIDVLDDPPADDAPSLRRFVARAGTERWLAIDVLAAVDPEGTDRIVEGLDRLGRTEDLDDLEPALDGNAVMRLLGLDPGREVGAAVDFLRELRLDEGPLDRTEMAERLMAWWPLRPDLAGADDQHRR